ncbi:MAG: hypothetical protein J0I48_09240 [Devosia sp.]|jgi:hypothetical protein|uniref:hypothetical protein n=1 Tax=Devosia sp. 66-22 TaxID=1895753 RepID=UPI00092684BE|nr:hypothetical protein [Devosia sp. 66-22]MBN9346372.1 hypothetical protein [Devosia sp.]OJX52372.1 MAG: hypothetical protein BGO81_09250 [Devosia sp. 66-22]
MALSLLKTGAIAATALILSASGAFAATYGHVNYDTKVKKSWTSSSSTVWYLDEGDYVKVINYTSNNGGWFRIDPPGPNNAGWVKKSAIDLEYDDYDDGDDVNLTICGPGLFGGSFCLQTN